MSSSREPSRRRPRHATDPAGSDASPEDWATRGLAVVVAVPVFAVSLYLGLATLTMSPRRALLIFWNLPTVFYSVYFGLALGVGLRFGFSGLTRLLGHLFGTHFVREANGGLTVLLWAGLIVATLAAYALGAPRGG
jgi:hypothetical protein